jgi:hypothetical protein
MDSAYGRQWGLRIADPEQIVLESGSGERLSSGSGELHRDLDHHVLLAADEPAAT